MRRVSRTRKVISTLFILAGLAGVGIWGWSIVHSRVSQKEASQEFDELPRTAPVKPGNRLPPPQDGAIIGRLTIPRLNVKAMVREGTDSRTLDVALGHVSGTALPGTAGNVAIAGHRDTLFRPLRKIAKDDVIVFQTTSGSYTYRVENTSIVKPQDLAVLAPGPHSELTLVTCYPFYYVGAAPERFIVRARLLSPQAPATRTAALKSGQAAGRHRPKQIASRRANPNVWHYSLPR